MIPPRGFTHQRTQHSEERSVGAKKSAHTHLLQARKSSACDVLLSLTGIALFLCARELCVIAMKFPISTLLCVVSCGSTVAFTPTSSNPTFASRLNAAASVVTGPKGKAASSKEEDIRLTLQIIMDHEARSTTTSKDQFISQMEEQAAQTASEEEVIDISIPYDAAAKLAYEASDKSMEYDAFKAQYEADAVADVISKQPIDVSIPYDAAAKLAYEASDKTMAYDAFKAQYEADAVADVISKQPVDLSIPYDAAAKLAYEASDKSMAYDAFKAKYEADAVADVIAKQKVAEPVA